MDRLPLGLPPFFDLRGFASWAFQWRRFDLKFDAKRRKSKKVGHFPFQPHAVALFQYLQPSTQCTWSLDLSPQSITLRRATLGKNTGVVTFVSATTAETESAHVRRTLLTAVEFGGDTSLLSCTFCASARNSMAKFDRFLLFSASLGCQCSPLYSNGRKLRKSIKGR